VVTVKFLKSTHLYVPKIKLFFLPNHVYQNYLVVTLKQCCIRECSASNKTFMNINTRAEKCSSQSYYSHYGSYATDVIKAVDFAHTGLCVRLNMKLFPPLSGRIWLLATAVLVCLGGQEQTA